jgi:hypothetical protein
VTPVPRYGMGSRHTRHCSADSLGSTPLSSAGVAGFGLGVGGATRAEDLRVAEADAKGAPTPSPTPTTSASRATCWGSLA